MTKPFLVATAVIAAVTATFRRRQAQQSDTEALWREATADASATSDRPTPSGT